MLTKKAFAAFGALAMIAAVACSGDRVPLAPQRDPAAAQPSLTRAAQAEGEPAAIGQGTTLLRDVPLAENVTVSKPIGPDGGDFEIPAVGLRVYVPRGAVDRPTTITATALAGDMVAYEFGPHGTRFALPLIVAQATKGTHADSLPPGTVLQLGYFTSADALDRVKKKARIAELISRLAFVTDDSVVFPVWHFSGYTVVWGFKRDAQDEDRNR
jgi:hypothetical protein